MDFLSFLDPLVEPTFIDRNNPPLKIDVSAKVIGWIAVVLSAIALLALLLVGIAAVFVVGTTMVVGGVTTGHHPGIFIVAVIGLVLLIIAWLLALVGGWQMTQGNHDGRRLLIQALALSLIFSLIYNIGLSNISRFVFQLVVNAIVYYFVLISRFPDEAPVTTSPTPGVSPPGSPQSPGGSGL